MDETNPPIEQPEPEAAPLIPSEPLPPIDSRFLFVDVAALRAKQLKRGAVKNPDLAANSVTGPKVKRRSLESSDL